MKPVAAVVIVLVSLAAPRVASADIVRLTSGATLSVKSTRVDGDTMVMVMRGGGEMRTPRALIAEVLPDEKSATGTADASTTFTLPTYEAPKVLSAAGSVQEMIDRLAPQFGVPVTLAHALVRVESNYQAHAVSPKGAMGLMQLMPATARQYAVDHPFDRNRTSPPGCSISRACSIASTRRRWRWRPTTPARVPWRATGAFRLL